MTLTARAYDFADILDSAPEGIKILSLDCFDTLLWRNTNLPVDVFAELPLRGSPIEARIWGETRDITFIGHGKSDLDAVVDEVAALQGRTVVPDQFPDRGSFYREGGPAGAYDAMDIPGVFPLFTDPGDLIIFAGRTYHGVYPHGGNETRLSCAFAFRSGRRPHPTPWPLPESARRFIQSAPPAIRPLVEHYPSIVPGWKGSSDSTEPRSNNEPRP